MYDSCSTSVYREYKTIRHSDSRIPSPIHFANQFLVELPSHFFSERSHASSTLEHAFTRSPRFCLEHCHTPSRTSLSTLSTLSTLPHFHHFHHFHRPPSTFHLPPLTLLPDRNENLIIFTIIPSFHHPIIPSSHRPIVPSSQSSV